MKSKLFLHLFLSFVMLVISRNEGHSQVSDLENIKNTSGSAFQFILNRYTKTSVVEKISYDEEKTVFTGLPQNIEAEKLHYLDIPYAVTTNEKKHVDEVLTANGEYLKIITYISKQDLGDKWPSEAKYRLFLNDRVIALNSNMEVIAETPNSSSYILKHKEKGFNALSNGLFQWAEFQKVTTQTVAEAEKAGFKIEVNDGEYRFIKDGSTLLIYDQEHMYTGQVQKEGEIEVERINYFKRNEVGQIIPSHTRVHYEDKLPTGIKVMKRELTVVTNFIVEGKRYSQLNMQSQSGSGILKISPNPVQNILYCQLTLNDVPENKMITYQVEDVTGRIFIIVQKMKADNVSGIDISKLPAGVYLLRVFAGKQSMQQKFVKVSN
jgi:Secretion system C-terminal sorting domain